MSNLNIEYCCTCLKVCAEQDRFLSLGFLSSQQTTYRKKLKFCVPEMGPEIEGDSYMCKPCSIALERAYTFRCMCIRTEGMLSSFRVKGNSKDVNGGKKDLVQLLLTQNNAELLPKANRSLNNSHSVIGIDDHNSVEIIRELGSLLSESLSSTKNEIERHSRPKNDIDISSLASNKKEIEILNLSNIRKKTETSSLSDIKKKIETSNLSDAKKKPETSSVSDTKKKIETSSLADPKKKTETTILSETRKKIETLILSSPSKIIETSNFSDTKKRIETSSLPNTRKRTEIASLSNIKDRIETSSPSDTKKKTEETASAPITRKRTEIASLSNIKERIQTSSPFDTKKRIAEILGVPNTRQRTETASLSNINERIETSSPLNTRKKLEASYPSDATSQTETAKIKVKNRPVSPLLPQAKRQCLTDDEIITMSCQTDPGLQNVSPEELNCQVTLEKLTITELPVIIPSRPSNTKANKLQKEFPCNKCGKVLKKKEYYYSHILKHSNIRAFRCKVCPSAYFSADALRIHRRRHHPDSVQPTPKANEVKPKVESAQKIAPKPKAESPRTNTNANSKSNEGQEVFNCLYCAFQTTSKPTFTQHVSLHTVNGKYPCPHCQKTFIPFWGLTKHVREAHAKTDTSQPNKKIMKALPIIIKSEPVTELEPPHEEPTPVKDESKRTETNGAEASVSAVKKRKKYFCPQCNNEFSSRDHANIHTGEKPYTCGFCLKKFGAYSTLRVHRKIHTKNDGANDVSNPAVVVHSCEICKQSFSNSYDATSHSCQTSTGETVYRCQICKNAYLGRTALVDHMRMHLEEND